MPETRFGKYLLYERIAVGGMAEVFRAKPQSSDRVLALKRIHPHHLENDDFVSMLIDEAKISFQLDHPNIVQVVDMGRVDKHYFIAMEYIAGRDLRRVIERLAESGRPFPVADACAIIAQVAKGLDYAHAKSDGRGKRMEIIHRDISPQNILCGFDGLTKVIDFGIAKAAGRLMETQVGILKGKYAYMSPEQAAGGRLDQRTDIFSTGIMLYECLVGKHPFRAPHDLETLRNIKHGTMVPPREANPALPASVERIIFQALSPEKEDRYFTAGALAADLEKALQKIQPGYSQQDCADFVGGLFADEIAGEASGQRAGGNTNAATKAAPKPDRATSPRGGGAVRLNRDRDPEADRPTLERQSLRADRGPAPIAAVPPTPRPRVSVSVEAEDDDDQSMVNRVRGASSSFVDRIQTGALTTAENVVLIFFATIVFGFALFLLVR